MTAGADWLAAAPVLGESQARDVTGNEWLSLPDIDPAGGRLLSLSVLHEGAGGLLELAGLPAPGGQLLAPFCYTRAPEPQGAGWQPAELTDFRWGREYGWLPEWTASADGLRLTGRIVVPPGYRGALYRLEVASQAEAAREVTLGLGGTWAETRQVLFASRPINATSHAWYDDWTQSLVLECRPGTSLLGWAVGADRPLSTCLLEAVPARQAAADSSLQLELGLDASSSPAHPWRIRLGEIAAQAAEGAVVRFFAGCTLCLDPGETQEVSFFLGVGTDADGARLAVADLRRRGAAPLHAAARRDLASRAVSLNPERVGAALAACGETTDQEGARQAAASLEALLNRNLTFNRFFATGRALDTGRPALVTSRSPHYYRRGAFQARDAFLWSFPALLLSDRRAAREALVLGLTRYAAHGPLHASYLDGRSLCPGFELDGLAAPLWAFDHYLDRTHDTTLWSVPGVEEGVTLILRRFLVLAADGRQEEAEGLELQLVPLRRRRGALLPTFLDPGAGRADAHPYLTFPNALAWSALSGFARLAERQKGWEEKARQARQLAEALHQGLEEHLRCGREPRRSFALATDGGGGGLLIGDHPAGSLALLPYLGFCEKSDPVFQRTFAGLNFPGNPFYLPGPFGGRGDRHAPYPSVIARASDLLAGDPSALAFFLHAPLDNGLACESVDPRTGVAKTGAGYAAAAGWVAWCLYQVLA